MRASARRKCITSEAAAKTLPERFERAVARFAELNARDPNFEWAEGREWPREQLSARRLVEWVLKLRPNASEVLRLAAHCQHLCRWKVPRANYPLDRAGYHRWKNDLKQFHAGLAGEVLRECGYEQEVIGQVQELVLKKNFPADPESQVMEDALCLVFLQFQLDDLASRTDPEKIVNALRKSWAKMSPAAREFALRLECSPCAKQLVQAALT